MLMSDGQMTALYENIFYCAPGSLGPCCSRQPPFTFRGAFLDCPSTAATEIALQLLRAARISIQLLDFERDWERADAIFLAMFRQLLEGASRSPTSPEQDGLIDVIVQPVLTEALASFAIHDSVTVGQSMKAVASANEGVVYGDQGNR